MVRPTAARWKREGPSAEGGVGVEPASADFACLAGRSFLLLRPMRDAWGAAWLADDNGHVSYRTSVLTSRPVNSAIHESKPKSKLLLVTFSFAQADIHAATADSRM